ncbi:MAG: tyrosine-type recombinase/integrase [Solirubrobacterales bacterium]
MNLSQLIEGFFLVRRDELAATTKVNYRYCAVQLLDFFGEDIEVADITPEGIRTFADAMKLRGLTDRTRADKLTITSSFLAFAEREFGIPNVMRQVARPEWKRREIDPLTESEIKALVKAAEWSRPWAGRAGKPTRSRQPMWLRNVAIILTLVDTGIRASELCNLEMRDYDRSEHRLDIRHGKGDKQRFVYLGAVASKALWRYRVERSNTPNAPMFATKQDTIMDRTNLADTLQTIGNNADVRHVHPHRFRHTFAINFLRNGGNVFELQKLLGHERLETVQVYLQLAQSDLRKAHNRASPADRWNL